MENTREFTISVLKDLIQNCMEEQSLFKKASKRITDPKLLLTIKNYLEEKASSINKLKREIKRLGGNLNNLEGEPDTSDNSKDITTDYDDERILLECVNKDVMILDRYSNAIKEEILWEVIPLVAKQYFESQNMHENLMLSFGNYQHLQYNIT